MILSKSTLKWGPAKNHRGGNFYAWWPPSPLVGCYYTLQIYVYFLYFSYKNNFGVNTNDFPDHCRKYAGSTNPDVMIYFLYKCILRFKKAWAYEVMYNSSLYLFLNLFLSRLFFKPESFSHICVQVLSLLVYSMYRPLLRAKPTYRRKLAYNTM